MIENVLNVLYCKHDFNNVRYIIGLTTVTYRKTNLILFANLINFIDEVCCSVLNVLNFDEYGHVYDLRTLFAV